MTAINLYRLGLAILSAGGEGGASDRDWIVPDWLGRAASLGGSLTAVRKRSELSASSWTPDFTQSSQPWKPKSSTPYASRTIT